MYLRNSTNGLINLSIIIMLIIITIVKFNEKYVSYNYTWFLTFLHF